MSDNEMEMDVVDIVDDEFCDPEKPRDWCHFKDIVVDGMGMDQMNAANIYFVIVSWVNFVVPFGTLAMWALLVVDVENNILPLVTSLMGAATDITDLVATVSAGMDTDADGAVSEAEYNAFFASVSGFSGIIDGVLADVNTVIGLFSWPLIAGIFLNFCIISIYYWPINYWGATVATVTPRTSAYYAHIKALFWTHLVLGWVPAFMSFLDTTTLGSGTFSMTGNGLIFLV